MTASPDSENLEKYTSVVKLMDGSSLRIRAIRPGDRERLIDFVSRLSSHSRYLRFHHVVSGLSAQEAGRFCDVDYKDSLALVAVVGEGAEEKIIAVGRYYRAPGGDTAEAAFAVEDRYQGKGIATCLLEQLALIARGIGIRIFEAFVLYDNKDMQEVFLNSGFRVSEQFESGVLRMLLDIA